MLLFTCFQASTVQSLWSLVHCKLFSSALVRAAASLQVDMLKTPDPLFCDELSLVKCWHQTLALILFVFVSYTVMLWFFRPHFPLHRGVRSKFSSSFFLCGLLLPWKLQYSLCVISVHYCFTQENIFYGRRVGLQYCFTTKFFYICNPQVRPGPSGRHNFRCDR